MADDLCRFRIQSSQTTGTATSEFTITNAVSNDEGLYECTASNMYGEDSDALFIQVQGKTIFFK